MASDQRTKNLKSGSYFSVSQLKMFDSCPHKWYLKYVLKLKEPEQDYFEIGKFGHKVIEYYFKGKNYNKLIDDNENKDQRAISRHSLKALIEFEKQNGAIKAIGIEEEFLTPIYNPQTGKPALLPMYGFKDLITIDDVIIDWKFLSQIPEENIYLNDKQSIGYAAAYYSKTGKIPKKIMFGCFRKMMTKGELKFFEVYIDEWQIEEFWRDVNSFVKRVKMEEFHRQPSHKCRFCPFVSTCKPFQTQDKLYY